MEAIYAHVPGLKVLVPSTPVDAAGLLRSAIEDPDPVLFFEPARLYRSIAQELPAQAIRAPIGVASVSRGGSQVTILTWGSMVRDAITAADQVENDGVSVEVLDLRSLVPLDINAITDSVAKTGRAIVLHEAPRTGGFGADVAAQIQEHCFSLLKSPVRRITGWDTVFPLRLSEHLYMPSVERISSIVKQVVLE
jgi:pyruvate/2-oxoglutarate/acetoin dehydrogenase E1 component